jgi:D-alanyl-lipoteichoic acid acyltransferase DltB (MBOAT superfamily)
MLFNSLEYAAFLPVVVLVYFLLASRFRWVWLLAASYFFYMCWRPHYLILILVSTAVDYAAGILMESARSTARKRLFLIISLASNLGLLFAFKYFNFASESLRALLAYFGLPYEVPMLEVLLPVGISFYTFQTLSYTIDVYRGEREAERHLGRFALYVAFFPQLVAGPIERSTHLLPQFKRIIRFDYDRLRSGLSLILWGLFKKIVIADRLAQVVDHVYEFPGTQPGIALLLATYAFAYQIYCDFSGYSDIAIGSARILGYDLMTNFRSPYHATSISDFWKRWHISLSTWFRDYLYISLGGNRVAVPRWYANLMIVFILSGLWHGANWTFIIWGALHGGYLICGVLREKLLPGIATRLGLDRWPRLLRAGRVILVFHLVCLGWIFFRAQGLGQAVVIVRRIVSDLSLTPVMQSTGVFEALKSMLGVTVLQMVVVFLAVILMESVETLAATQRLQAGWQALPVQVRWAAYLALALIVANFGMFHTPTEFIYFQF